ncbi:agouti signaling protein 1 [Osmerus mordax]|uniref:agouti signaling protein 1 n=1 Tax=Osmerus mordax TaxID=8014 RepID=UPI00350F5939
MPPVLLLVCLVLACSSLELVQGHMVPEQSLVPNRSSNGDLGTHVPSDAPPILIIELPKTVKKNKKSKKPKKQNKFSTKKKRPPPPPNCVPLWGSCKSPGNVCCEQCAFCHCRLFKTVCYCRMGNPRC